MPQDSQRPHLTSAPVYSPAHPSGRVGSGAGDESHLVDDMCTPGGLRAQPDREDLRLFVENAASLNGTTVAELLQAKMVCMQVILRIGGCFEMPWLSCVRSSGWKHTLSMRQDQRVSPCLMSLDKHHSSICSILQQTASPIWFANPMRCLLIACQ